MSPSFLSTPSSLIGTPFGAASTVADVVAGLDLTGRRAVVTGGASGIGVETARALVGAGADVTLAVHDVAAGIRIAQDLASSTGRTSDGRTTGGGTVRVAPLDLADPSSVAAFVAGWRGPLHMLVNNAGVMAAPLARTAHGWELQFATNHLGHFALATGLHPALAAAGGARVVSVSSAAHLRSPVVFHDIHFRRRAYDPWLAYGQSKTANVLFAVEATRLWADDGITANALNPGGITWKTPEQCAATSVLLAASPLLDGVGGRYFENCAEAAPNVPETSRGVAAYALDPEAATLLWQLSLDMLASHRLAG